MEYGPTTTTTNEQARLEHQTGPPEASHSTLAERDNRRDEARQRWLEVLQPDAEQAARFDEVYIGDYASLEAFGQALAEQSGWREQIAQVVPDVALANLQFDHEGVACDLWLSGHVRIIDHADGMWLYRRHLEPTEEQAATPDETTDAEGR